MALTFNCTFSQTTNYLNDTANSSYTTSGAPLTGPPDWTAACTNYVAPPWNNVDNFYTSPVFSSTWNISGTGGNGEIVGIYFMMSAQYGANDETNPRKSIVVIINSGVFTQNNSYTINPPPALCLTKGTRVLTPNGYTPVEDLTKYNYVTTADGRNVTIKHIHHSKHFSVSEMEAPFFVPVNALGDSMPSHDVKLSPDHLVLVGEDIWLSPRHMANQSDKITQYNLGETIDYYAIATQNYFHDNLVIEDGSCGILRIPKDGLRRVYESLSPYSRLGMDNS